MSQLSRRIVVGASVLALLVAVGMSLRASRSEPEAGQEALAEGRGGDLADSLREQAEDAVGELRSKVDPVGLSGARSRAGAAPGWQAEALWSATANDWEPAVAADPGSSYVYQATTRYGGPKACKGNCPDPAIIVRSSSDGGVTWGPDRFICVCKTVKGQNDPQLAVATNGTLFAVWLNDYNPGVVFSKSTNRGVTWSTPIKVSGPGFSFSDKPILLVSPNGQDVYVAWNSSDSYVSVSHDAGASFAAPIKTNGDTLYWFAEGGAIAPDGTVYFSESAENQSATGQVKLAVLRSIDAGATWTTSFVGTSQQQPPCTLTSCLADFFASQAGVAVDAAGTVIVVYTANSIAQAAKDLYVRTSSDRGGTWSAPVEIGQNTGDAGFPVIESGPTGGDFRIAWQDNRNGSTAWNTWYTRTTNGGGAWSTQIRLSDVTSGAPYKAAGGYAFPYGDYFDLDVSAGGVNHVIWSEGTNYVGPGGSWYTRGS